MRLIDADALIKYLDIYASLYCNFMIKRSIDKAPTIEAEPVRHGEWQEHFSNGCWYYDCPFCDDGYAVKERDEHPANYCSNCGAKMDGKEREE